MALKAEDGRKWILAFVLIVALIGAYLSISFFDQMSEWFDLEAKVQNFPVVNQVFGILVGLAVFVGVSRHPKAKAHMEEVYGELVKVIWAEKDMVSKLTVGIVIGLTIMSTVFLLFDLSFRKLLELVY